MSKELTIPELQVNYTPIEISFNFDEINARLDEYLENKISLVTEETIKEEKKVVASLRKEGDLIKSTFKQYKEKAIAPLTDVEKQISLIVDKFKQTADAKNEQVKLIEDETRESCLLLLKDYLADSWEDNEVILEFRKASIDGLVKLGSLTPKGELTKAAKQAVDSLVAVDLSKQTTIQARLMSVEIKSLRADIQPPLSRANVEAFLYADDFELRLDTLIAAEVARKQEAEERLRKKLEAENQRKIDDALKAQQAEANRIAKEEADKQRAAEELQRKQAEAQIAASKPAQVEEKTIVEDKPSQTQEIEARLRRLSEMNARFPDKETSDAMKTAREELKKVQGSTNYTLKFIVEFSIKSREDADTEKMKEFFIGKLNGSVEAEGKRVTLISLVKG